MKTIVHILLVISTSIIATISLFAQAIPPDSLYLGQTPPGNIPRRFNLPVSTGSFAAERIAISNDSTEIYYSEVHSYYPITGAKIKYYRFSGGSWTGPFDFFQGFLAPALSASGDTMYFQNSSSVYESFLSVRNGLGWSNPQRILSDLNSAHYLQVTNNGHHYISSIPTPTVGASDWCKLVMNGTDTTAVSLGLPLNTSGDNLDFFVSRDESFMVIATPTGLCISYHKNDNRWTNRKNLGSTINFGLGMWGPYVTADKKYLFYSTGTRPDYSDVYVHWVRVDGLIDSLMRTNFVPYLRNAIPAQSIQTGQLFSYTVPDSTFVDDDGNNTLTYSANLSNGNPLPAWLSFDPATRTFSGTPTSVVSINVKVTATDTANASVSSVFPINVTVTGIEKDDDQLPDGANLYQNYPNPFNPTTTIEFAIPKTGRYTLSVYNPLGELVREMSAREYQAGRYNETLDATGLSSGMYLYRLTGENTNIVRKMIVLR